MPINGAPTDGLDVNALADDSGKTSEPSVKAVKYPLLADGMATARFIFLVVEADYLHRRRKINSNPLK